MSDSPSTSLIPVEDLPFDRINDILEPTCLDENGDPYLCAWYALYRSTHLTIVTVDAWIVNLTNPIQTRELIRFVTFILLSYSFQHTLDSPYIIE